MGVMSSLDATSSLIGRKASPDTDPKGKKSAKHIIHVELCRCYKFSGFYNMPL